MADLTSSRHAACLPPSPSYVVNLSCRDSISTNLSTSATLNHLLSASSRSSRLPLPLPPSLVEGNKEVRKMEMEVPSQQNAPLKFNLFRDTMWYATSSTLCRLLFNILARSIWRENMGQRKNRRELENKRIVRGAAKWWLTMQVAIVVEEVMMLMIMPPAFQLFNCE